MDWQFCAGNIWHAFLSHKINACTFSMDVRLGARGDCLISEYHELSQDDTMTFLDIPVSE